MVIIGSDPPPALVERAAADVVVTGYVKDLRPYFQAALASVAPLRYGAGIKGKIVMSMSHDCPVVCTSVAAEGMRLDDGSNVLVAENALEFAKHLLSIYSDQAIRATIVQGGRTYISSRYSKSVVAGTFEVDLA